jgi:hypothetical protein
MRNRAVSLAMGCTLAGCLAIGVTGSAGAATLAFTGTLELAIANKKDTAIELQGAGLATVSITGANHLASLALPAGVFGPLTTSLPGTSWGGSTNSIIFTGVGNLAGSFSGISGGPPGGGTMGLSGLAKICLIFASCQYSSVTIPLTPTTGVGGFGVGGLQVFPGAVAVSMLNAPWTVGQPVLTFHTANSTISTPTLPGGFAHGPASLTSSTAQPSGALQLVTVSKVLTSLTSYGVFPVTGVLTLHFVPEPGTALLLGSAVAVLAVYGRRRQRR